jgi:hypothetical protein
MSLHRPTAPIVKSARAPLTTAGSQSATPDVTSRFLASVRVGPPASNADSSSTHAMPFRTLAVSSTSSQRGGVSVVGVSNVRSPSSQTRRRVVGSAVQRSREVVSHAGRTSGGPTAQKTIRSCGKHAVRTIPDGLSGHRPVSALLLLVQPVLARPPSERSR